MGKGPVYHLRKSQTRISRAFLAKCVTLYHDLTCVSDPSSIKLKLWVIIAFTSSGIFQDEVL